MSAWRWYWALWLLLGFCVPEAIALYRAIRYRESGHTLSENVRAWFATDVRGWADKSASAKLRRLFLFLGMCWLMAHWMVPDIF